MQTVIALLIAGFGYDQKRTPSLRKHKMRRVWMAPRRVTCSLGNVSSGEGLSECCWPSLEKKKKIVRGLRMDDRGHLSLVHGTWVSEDIEARCFLKVPGFWLCLLGTPVAGGPAEAVLCWAHRRWEGWSSLPGAWQWRGWLLLLPSRQTHSGFGEALPGTGNQPHGCGCRAVSRKETKKQANPNRNQSSDAEQK